MPPAARALGPPPRTPHTSTAGTVSTTCTASTWCTPRAPRTLSTPSTPRTPGTRRTPSGTPRTPLALVTLLLSLTLPTAAQLAVAPSAVAQPATPSAVAQSTAPAPAQLAVAPSAFAQSTAPAAAQLAVTPSAVAQSTAPAPAQLAVALSVGAQPAGVWAGGWGLAPVGGGRPAFYAEGTAGAVLRDTVAVTNRGRAPVSVRLRGSGVPAVFARSGLRIPARTRAEVPFTVTVPRDAGPGDRTGAIVARDAHGRTATVPVRLRVGGPALAALTVEHLAVHPDRITYELVNRGTTVLVPRLAVRADGVFGRVLDRAPRTLPVRLPPGARRTLSEPWPGRPVLDEVRVRLTVTAAGGARDTADTSAAFVPWGAVTGGSAAVAAGAAVLLRRRRGHRTPTAPPPAGAEPTGAVS